MLVLVPMAFLYCYPQTPNSCWLHLRYLTAEWGIPIQEWSDRPPEVRPYSWRPSLAVIGSTYAVQMGTVSWKGSSTPRERLLLGKTISWTPIPRSVARDILKYCVFHWDAAYCSLLVTFNTSIHVASPSRNLHARWRLLIIPGLPILTAFGATAWWNIRIRTIKCTEC